MNVVKQGHYSRDISHASQSFIYLHILSFLSASFLIIIERNWVRSVENQHIASIRGRNSHKRSWLTHCCPLYLETKRHLVEFSPSNLCSTYSVFIMTRRDVGGLLLVMRGAVHDIVSLVWCDMMRSILCASLLFNRKMSNVNSSFILVKM